jgi:hypothetical protein
MDMKTCDMEVWKYGEMDMEVWKYGEMDMETWTGRHGHGDMNMETGT